MNTEKLDAPFRTIFLTKNWIRRTIFLSKNWMLPHDFSVEKLKCFFHILSISSNFPISLVDPEYNARARARAAAAPHPQGNVWDVYERAADEWNRSPEVQARYTNRIRMINNTDGYHTGNQTLHIRSIQIYGAVDWNALFGTEQLEPILREYAQSSIEYAEDETGTVPFAGQMEVSLIMQENYRRGIHLGIFMVHLTPHRRFYDGHIIQKEFSEGSRTHQIINRLFDTNTRAVVLQATQYQFLEYLADYDEALDLINDCFLDPDFTTMRFSYVADPHHPGRMGDGGGHYVVNHNALDNHRLHCCAQDQAPAPNENIQVAVAVAIPPPPPIPDNDIGEIYRRNIEMYDAQHNDDDDDDDNIIRNHRHYDPEQNIIQYHYDDYDDDDDRYPVQG